MSDQLIAQCVLCHNQEEIQAMDPKLTCSKCGGRTSQFTRRMLSPDELAKYGPPSQIKNRDGVKRKPPATLPDRSSEEQRRRANMRYHKEEQSMKNQPKDGQAVKSNVPTKEEFLRQRATGKSISKIEREHDMPLNGLQYWINKWGLKGVDQGRAQQLLDEMVIDGAATRDEAPKPVPEVEPVIREKHLQDEKDIEIQRLRNELAETIGDRNQLREAAKGAAVISNQAGEEIQALRAENRTLIQERDDYKRAAEDLETKIIEAPPVLLERVELPPVRAKRSMRIEVTDNQNVIEDELLAVLAYVQAMHGKSFTMELYLGEA